jgi:hypothetical protein
VGTSNIRRLAAIVVVICVVFHGQRALAQNYRIWDLNHLSVIGMVVVSFANIGTSVADIGFIFVGERSYGLAAASFVVGTISIAAGIAATVHDPYGTGTLRNFGKVTIVTSGINIALAAVQLAQPFKKWRQKVALSPVTLVDSSGQLTAGAGLTGRF